MRVSPPAAALATLVVAAAALTPACATAPVAERTRRALVYETDFGVKDGAVAEMKGVALAIDPSLQLLDLTHEIPPFDIWTGAHRLAMAAPYFPAGTVFVCVIDPGVGTDRGNIVMRTKSGHVFVGPDNGLFTLVARELDAVEVRDIDVAAHWRKGAEGSTFFGRDLYSVVGARLAAGRIGVADVGPPARTWVRLALPGFTVDDDAAGVRRARGVVPLIDVQYGNVWTNVPVKSFPLKPGERVHVVVRDGDVVKLDAVVPYSETFGDVPRGAPLAYANSLGDLAFALNQGDLAATHAIAAGAGVTVEATRVP